MNRIALADCELGRVYKVNSRNLKFAVYDGNNGFIGIRTKFGRRFLFIEIHWDADERFGTVSEMEPMNITVDPEILLGAQGEGPGHALFDLLEELEQ